MMNAVSIEFDFSLDLVPAPALAWGRPTLPRDRLIFRIDMLPVTIRRYDRIKIKPLLHNKRALRNGGGKWSAPGNVAGRGACTCQSPTYHVAGGGHHGSLYQLILSLFEIIRISDSTTRRSLVGQLATVAESDTFAILFLFLFGIKLVGFKVRVIV